MADTFEVAGRNLAIIQNKGRMMTFLNMANMTLSLAEIVDMDSMIPLLGKDKIEDYSKIHSNICESYNIPQAPLGYIKDARDELFALGKFLKSFDGIADIQTADRDLFCNKFVQAYLNELNKLDEQKLDIILKKNLITSLNDSGFNHKLSEDETRNAELVDFLQNNRSKVGNMIEYPARLENIGKGEEKDKLLEIFDALNNLNEVGNLKKVVENLATRIIKERENIKSITKVKKELA